MPALLSLIYLAFFIEVLVWCSTYPLNHSNALNLSGAHYCLKNKRMLTNTIRCRAKCFIRHFNCCVDLGYLFPFYAHFLRPFDLR
uniref:Uncharacterized protein n=1 Tax=uncultured marine virus TaxID=186617 RepID=A0A0F7L0X8_9VIRU|nr:hypothetical protein [uncultured marine virus]